jgi:hypothetical protein
MTRPYIKRQGARGPRVGTFSARLYALEVGESFLVETTPIGYKNIYNKSADMRDHAGVMRDMRFKTTLYVAAAKRDPRDTMLVAKVERLPDQPGEGNEKSLQVP